MSQGLKRDSGVHGAVGISVFRQLNSFGGGVCWEGGVEDCDGSEEMSY